MLLFFSHLVMSNPLQLHGEQHARPPCPSPSLEVCPSLCPLHQWCQPAISSSDALFSFCPQSFPESGAFPTSQLFASDDQNTGASASASVLPMSIQGWFPLRLTGLIALLSKGFPGVLSSTTVQRHQFFDSLPSLQSSSHNPTWPLGRLALPIWTFVSRVIYLLFNTLSRLVSAFLSGSNCLLISWLQSPPAVILEPKKRKSVIIYTFSLLFAMKWWGWMSWFFFFSI